MGFIHEHIILPLSDLLKGERVHHYMRLLREAEQWDEAQMHAFQERRFRKIICFASREVPFYRDWFKDNGLNPETVKLSQLPIVNKSVMRKEGLDRFTAECFPKQQRRYSRSSGSTGEPFSFYVSKESYSVNVAAKIRTWYQSGYRLGDSYMKIAHGFRHGNLKKLQDRVNHCDYEPFLSIDDDAMKAILDRMEQTRPLFVRSYPIPLYLLAKYRLSHSEYQFRPHHIMTTGSTLPITYRKTMELAFGCDVIDSYSCEGTPNIYETPAHLGYRITGFYGIVEVLDNQDHPVRDGVGRVVSTDLWNYAHPFVRYDTQDMLEVRDGIVQRILGRECESIVESNGNRYTVHSFVGFFQEENRPTRKSIDAYQIVKKQDGSITFRLVVNDGYNDAVGRYIIDYWKEKLNVPIQVEIVDGIPLMDNNKRLTIVDE